MTNRTEGGKCVGNNYTKEIFFLALLNYFSKMMANGNIYMGILVIITCFIKQNKNMLSHIIWYSN